MSYTFKNNLADQQKLLDSGYIRADSVKKLARFIPVQPPQPSNPAYLVTKPNPQSVGLISTSTINPPQNSYNKNNSTLNFASKTISYGSTTSNLDANQLEHPQHEWESIFEIRNLSPRVQETKRKPSVSDIGILKRFRPTRPIIPSLKEASPKADNEVGSDSEMFGGSMAFEPRRIDTTRRLTMAQGKSQKSDHPDQNLRQYYPENFNVIPLPRSSEHKKISVLPCLEGGLSDDDDFMPRAIYSLESKRCSKVENTLNAIHVNVDPIVVPPASALVKNENYEGYDTEDLGSDFRSERDEAKRIIVPMQPVKHAGDRIDENGTANFSIPKMINEVISCNQITFEFYKISAEILDLLDNDQSDCSRMPYLRQRHIELRLQIERMNGVIKDGNNCTNEALEMSDIDAKGVLSDIDDVGAVTQNGSSPILVRCTSSIFPQSVTPKKDVT